jgi:hypothetical protein
LLCSSGLAPPVTAEGIRFQKQRRRQTCSETI